MTWLQYGGNTVYIPAHARPSILARLLGLARVGRQAMSIAVLTANTASSQVRPIAPIGTSHGRGAPQDATAAGPPDGGARWLSPRISVSSGYFVAHADPAYSGTEKTEDRPIRDS